MTQSNTSKDLHGINKVKQILIKNKQSISVLKEEIRALINPSPSEILALQIDVMKIESDHNLLLEQIGGSLDRVLPSKLRSITRDQVVINLKTSLQEAADLEAKGVKAESADIVHKAYFGDVEATSVIDTTLELNNLTKKFNALMDDSKTIFLINSLTVSEISLTDIVTHQAAMINGLLQMKINYNAQLNKNVSNPKGLETAKSIIIKQNTEVNRLKEMLQAITADGLPVTIATPSSPIILLVCLVKKAEHAHLAFQADLKKATELFEPSSNLDMEDTVADLKMMSECMNILAAAGKPIQLPSGDEMSLDRLLHDIKESSEFDQKKELPHLTWVFEARKDSDKISDLSKALSESEVLLNALDLDQKHLFEILEKSQG